MVLALSAFALLFTSKHRTPSLDMIGVAEGIQVAEQAVALGKFVWDKTRTTLDLTLANSHSKIKLTRYVRFVYDGRCTVQPEVTVKHGENTSAGFRARTMGSRIKGALLYQICHADGRTPVAKELYLLVAWRINLGNNSFMLLDLVEKHKAIAWTNKRLEDLYHNRIQKRFEKTNAALMRTWSLDDGTYFTVSASMNNTRFGSMTVRVESADASQKDTQQPYTVRAEKFEAIHWDDEMDEEQGVHAKSKKAALGGSSVVIVVHNDCEDITLCNGELGMFDGKRSSEIPQDIVPEINAKISLKSSTVFRGRTRGCLVYEMVNHNTGMPVVWGYRTHIAIDVSVVPHDVQERKVAIKILATKDSAFPAVNDHTIEGAHKEVLYHFMYTYGRPSEWFLDQLNLRLDVSFNREPHAKLHVRLISVKGRPNEGRPLFFQGGDFSIPSRHVSDKIAAYISDPQKYSNHRLRLVENSMSMSSRKDNPLTLKLLHSARGSSPEMTVLVGDKDGSLFEREYFLYTQPHLEDEKARDVQLYAIRPSRRSRHASLGCVLALSQMKNPDKPGAYIYTTAVVYMPMQDGEGEKTVALVEHYLGHLKGRDNRFGEAQLIDREIQLPGGRDAHLAVYPSVKPPFLLTVALTDKFDLTFYKSIKLTCALAEFARHAPRPFYIRIAIRNEYQDLPLKLTNFVANGTPDTSIAAQEAIPGKDATITFKLPPQDRQHAIMLHYRCPSQNTSGIDICIHLSLLDARDSADLKQTTTVSYVGANADATRPKNATLETMYYYERATNTFMGQDEVVQPTALPTNIPERYAALRHAVSSGRPSEFDVVTCFAADQKQTEAAVMRPIVGANDDAAVNLKQ
ncbi:hypothetical protein THASP1DRAFT_28808 [Thamnocephalis sphaerospora]|uniref:Uncharacterized protein n=1 Tax=Thamnocephalis sphaerospora TaxID=78915 RepID=A0A4P9XTE3_9FUNG|nr:hypothetical protein THASP1DRAFT_28808 [Thamnocephalis sphaerospora]|eukprot:RKP09406.1 hypothetical protein THASP1DRAFT_28808 [Thamnocephalis sphaerospora]